MSNDIGKLRKRAEIHQSQYETLTKLYFEAANRETDARNMAAMNGGYLMVGHEDQIKDLELQSINLQRMVQREQGLAERAKLELEKAEADHVGRN